VSWGRFLSRELRSTAVEFLLLISVGFGVALVAV
jgi:hypothetical protein